MNKMCIRDRAFNAFKKDFVQNESIYELTSREARDNHLIDLIKAVNPLRCV